MKVRTRLLLVGLMAMITLVIFSDQSSAEGDATVRGVYGVEGLAKAKDFLKEARVGHIFALPEAAVLGRLKQSGLSVYLTLNVFGGMEAWQKYPDAIPVTATGDLLTETVGGVCPSHLPWRQERLALLQSWLNEFGKQGLIDGVWLDFIRYPGRWEEAAPQIADTCYCPRCLARFQAEKGIKLPAGIGAKAAADWLRANADGAWRAWKVAQIDSFVQEVRALIDQQQLAGKVRLGAFVVPWTQGERAGAVLRLLGQDVRHFAPYLDVLSPMLYQQMVGKTATWIGATAQYFADLAARPVWPILQAENVTGPQFAAALTAVQASGAAGVLVFTLARMPVEFWPNLAGFKANENLIPNPSLAIVPGQKGRLPLPWQHETTTRAAGDLYFFQPPDGREEGALGITAGLSRKAQWQVAIAACEAGKTYRFSGEFYRQDRLRPQYPEIRLWGQEYRLNSHRLAGQYQQLSVTAVCPPALRAEESFFAFRNTAPGATFWLRRPRLVPESPRPAPRATPISGDFFPIGAYDANQDLLAEMKKLGLNSAVIAMTRDNLEECIRQDLHCLLAVPHDPQQLLATLPSLAGLLRQGKFTFYVNDEPEIQAFPVGQAGDIQTILAEQFPDIPTAMAILRPQGVADYEQAADWFMLDQYPVPHMPLAWQADSLDEAAGHVARDRLQAVIQAFGGKAWAESGWPRLPSMAEMNCLAFLAVIHGSRGLYFYSYPFITADPQGKKDLAEVVDRLQRLAGWLRVANATEPVQLTMTGPYRVEPSGKAAVHCTMKNRPDQRMLLCANSLPTYTTALVEVGKADSGGLWRDALNDDEALAANGLLRLDFGPLAVKAMVTPGP